MVHTGFVERVLAQNKKLFREKRSIQLHVAVNLCHMNFLQMNFQNKIWLKVKIPGSNYRGLSVYSATTLANFFLPRLIMRPSPLKSSRVYFVEIERHADCVRREPFEITLDFRNVVFDNDLTDLSR